MSASGSFRSFAALCADVCNPRWLNIPLVFAKESACGGAHYVPKEGGLFGAGVTDARLGDLRGVFEQVLVLEGHGSGPCLRCDNSLSHVEVPGAFSRGPEHVLKMSICFEKGHMLF
jgi:hypothetical protein